MATHVYVGTSARTGGSVSGVFRRGASDGAWHHLVNVRSTMMAVALMAADRRQAHCVTRRGQTFSTLDDCGSWREVGLPEGAGSAVAVACG